MIQMRKIYVSVLAVCLTAMCGQAQNLNKEITLDKDVVPVEKKATKKNALPKVKKVVTKEKTSLNYSDWAVPTPVPTDIPTMLPYGYHTKHIFSDRRGYFDIGAGTQVNIGASAGYRIVDTETMKLSGWLQHNSTWGGKNSTQLITDDNQRLKQKFNNNTLGLDFSNDFGDGTLLLGAYGNFDNFNYYGGLGDYWDNNKQTFTNVGLRAGWKGNYDKSFKYELGLKYNYAGYNKGIFDAYNGAKENSVKLNLGGEYDFDTKSSVGADVVGDIVSRKFDAKATDFSEKNDFQMITVSPFYKFVADAITARLGVNVNFSFSDGAAIRLSPNASVDIKIVDGASLYAVATGGKRLNMLADMAALNRYSDPLGRYCNTFIPVDGEAGFKIGPFSGFYIKVFGGYGIFKNDLFAYLPRYYVLEGNPMLTDDNQRAASFYKSFDARGFKAGGEIEYKYRSIVDFTANLTYAPQKSNISADKYYKGYTLGLDRPKYVSNIDLKIMPIKPLALNVGCELRGGRSVVSESNVGTPLSYSLIDLDDVTNLKAGASYRFNDMLTIWCQASNLLNKKWDVMYGMGAQKLNFMGGIGIVF
jgi:hypothetical protein